MKKALLNFKLCAILRVITHTVNRKIFSTLKPTSIFLTTSTSFYTAPLPLKEKKKTTTKKQNKKQTNNNNKKKKNVLIKMCEKLVGGGCDSGWGEGEGCVSSTGRLVGSIHVNKRCKKQTTVCAFNIPMHTTGTKRTLYVWW